MFSGSSAPKHRNTGTQSFEWPIPVLMYHNITDEPEPGVSPYYQVNTSPHVFAEHMRFLADSGYKTITISEIVSLLNHRSTKAPFHHNTVPQSSDSQPSTLNSQLVCITFDDGFRSVYSQAYPILKQHGFTATVYLATAFIGDTPRLFSPNHRSTEAPKHRSTELPNHRLCLTWSEIRELAQAGLEFGSHTVSHPKLVELPWDQIRSELSDSKTEIEQHLQTSCTLFCYPFAFPQAGNSFCSRFRGTLLELGYTCCATTQVGCVTDGDDPLQLKRLPANSCDDCALLSAKLKGGYDWLAQPQALIKRAKALRRSSMVTFLRTETNTEAPTAAVSVTEKPNYRSTEAPGSKYAVITPVRNEADHIQNTIDSMLSQTIQPVAWVIVDDGSTDGTSSTIDAAAARTSWIRVIHRPDRGFRKSGGGVIEAFNEGLALLSELTTQSASVDGRDAFHRVHNSPGAITETPKHRAVPPSRENTETPAFDFLVKLDGDLQFASDYFARCFSEFDRDPKLGIGGGMICKEEEGSWVEEAENDPAFHVRGATKIYRRVLWEQLGGLMVAPGWDTLDELKANMLGWTTRTFREIKLLQLKSTGTADGSWKNWVKNGQANYITGYHPLFMVAKCIKRSVQKPYGLAALALFSGFAAGYLRGLPQVPDPALIGFTRQQQLNRLLGRQSLWSNNRRR